MTLLVRNEEDILDANLAYHLSRGVDLVIAIDNNSEDDTPRILEAYARTGKVHVIKEASDLYEQSRWVTQAARLAAREFSADWVINADADEFYWPPGGSLKDVFAAIPDRYGSLAMPVAHFVPRPDEEGFFADRMTCRENLSYKPKGKSLQAKAAHRARQDVTVAMGNHTVSGDGLAPVPGWSPISVLHFPLRSYAQYEKKIRSGGPAFTGGYQFKRVDDAHPYALYEQGRLPEHYRDKVVDDAAVAEGIREGTLAVDDRVKDFFKSSRDPRGGAFRLRPGDSAGAPATATGGTIAWPEDEPAVAELRADLARAVWQHEHDPVALERDKLRARLAAVERSRWWRLRPRRPRSGR